MRLPVYSKSLISKSPNLPISSIEVGPLCSSEPYGVTLLVDRGAAFVMAPTVDLLASPFYPQDEALLPYPTAAADGSYVHAEATYQGQAFSITYGKVSDNCVGVVLHSDQPMTLPLRWRQPFSGCKVSHWSKDGQFYATGQDARGGAAVRLWVQSQPAMTDLPDYYRIETTTQIQLPAVMLLSVGEADFTLADVPSALDKARLAYEARQVRSEGDWGDFVGAIAKTMNGSRMFSSLDRRVAHSIGRGWWLAHQYPVDGDDDMFPYFTWDTFFNTALAALEDPETARETTRAILAYQHADGMVPNYAHWPIDQQFTSVHRTNPPVGAMCVWKLHERHPDKAFLAEVYPKLLRWHDWFRVGRGCPGSKLLSWGNALGIHWNANLECGFDDTPAFEGTCIEQGVMNCYSVDLSSLWALDAQYLAKMARALGDKKTAKRLLAESDEVIAEMNEKLWNDTLGLYCHRMWQDNADGSPHFLTRIAPLNFYALACGAPDADRAARVLDYMHRPEKFWGEYPMPTLAYDDPRCVQGYWRGQVWGPASYLVWQGIMRYDTPERQAEYADRCVRMFMRSWNTPMQVCGENYNSLTGNLGDDPHYTWGALLPLIGLEALEAGAPVPSNIKIRK